MLAESGTAPRVHQDLARHATLGLTLDTYSEATEAAKAAAVASLTRPPWLAGGHPPGHPRAEVS